MNENNKLMVNKIPMESYLQKTVDNIKSEGNEVESYSVNEKKKQVEIIYKQQNDTRIRQTLTVLDNGIITNNSAIKDTISKKELKGTIMQLKSQGYTQKEISDITGVSQSYISTLLRK